MSDQRASGGADARGWRLAAFAIPGAPLLALSVPPIVFLPPYYVGHLQIDEAAVGALFLAARFLDLVINPTIGGLQDRTRAAFGRRRLWLAASTPVVMAAVWFAFIGLPPSPPIWLAGFAILSLYSSFASAMIAHLGWAGELEPDYHARTRVLGAVQVASTLGQVVVMALPAIVTSMGWGTFADGVHVMGWTIILALPACVAICVFSVREPPPQPAAERLGFGAALAALKSNEPLRRVLVPDFLVGAAQGMAGTLFIFYADLVAQLTNPSALVLVYFAAGLIGAPIWTVLGRRLGKHRALQIASLFWAVALAVIPFLPRGNEPLAFAFMALAGAPAVAGVMLLRAMMADVADEDELATGRQRSGLFFGLLLTTTKVGLAMGPASLILLAPFDFQGDSGALNSPSALLALTVLFAGGPAVMNVLTAWSLQNYPLDAARQKALRDSIHARRESAA